MDALKLVKMANEIAAFFESEPDHAVAVDGVAQHVKRFWEPRMRRAIYAWLDEQGGAGLRPLALEALRTQRTLLTPAEPSR